MMATGRSLDLQSQLHSMSPSPFERGFIQTVMDSRPSSGEKAAGDGSPPLAPQQSFGPPLQDFTASLKLTPEEVPLVPAPLARGSPSFGEIRAVAVDVNMSPAGA